MFLCVFCVKKREFLKRTGLWYPYDAGLTHSPEHHQTSSHTSEHRSAVCQSSEQHRTSSNSTEHHRTSGQSSEQHWTSSDQHRTSGHSATDQHRTSGHGASDQHRTSGHSATDQHRTSGHSVEQHRTSGHVSDNFPLNSGQNPEHHRADMRRPVSNSPEPHQVGCSRRGGDDVRRGGDDIRRGGDDIRRGGDDIRRGGGDGNSCCRSDNSSQFNTESSSASRSTAGTPDISLSACKEVGFLVISVFCSYISHKLSLVMLFLPQCSNESLAINKPNFN